MTTKYKRTCGTELTFAFWRTRQYLCDRVINAHQLKTDHNCGYGQFFFVVSRWKITTTVKLSERLAFPRRDPIY